MKNNYFYLCFLFITGILFAQPGTIDLSFNPDDVGFGNGDGPNSTVRTTAIQSDGKIIIGGRFTSFNGTLRNRIARLNTDGSLDTTFNPGTGANDEILTIVLQSDGKIIIGGGFTSFNGTIRSRIARLNLDGSLDTTFNPGTGVDNDIFSIVLQSDGQIIIGGDFISFNGTSRSRIARLNTDGSLDTSFNPGTGAYDEILTTTVQSDDKIIIGGRFESFNGTSQNYIARLNTDGSVDTTFNPGTGANFFVETTALQSDGKIIVGGLFNSFNGISRMGIARLNINGSLDVTFNPGSGAIGGIVSTTALQSDGQIIIGGSFASFNGTSRNRIARLNTDGSLDTTFNPGTGANITVHTTALQSNGKIIIGGNFTSYNGTSRNYFAYLNTDGSLDTAFNPGTGANSGIGNTALQSEGKIIIRGVFTSFNGTPRNYIARLNNDGSLDTTFSPGTGVDTGNIQTTTVQSDGKIIIGGEFYSFNGTPQNRIARLNTDGSLDTTFNPGTGVNSSVYTTALQSDGKIIIGGEFTSFNGTPQNRIARLNTDGSLDTTFNPGAGASSSVVTAALQPDGKIIIGGVFTSFNGTSRNRIARLNTDGSLDTTFDPGTGINDIFRTIALQPDGKIIIGGDFTFLNGTPRSRIARLNTDGSLDIAFNPGAGANNRVRTTTLQSDGKIIIGGEFTSFNGTLRNRIARLNTDGSLDTTFDPGTGGNNNIITTALQSDGKIIIGGQFTSYNGVGRNRIARIFGDPPVANDFCTTAESITLTTTNQSITFTLLEAAVQNEPGCAGTTSANYADVWYEFTMPFNGNVAITSQIVWNQFALYETCGGNELNCFSGNGLITGLQEGATYKLRVYRTESLALNPTFQSFSIQAFESAENDDCINATTINIQTTPQTLNFVLQSATIANEVGCLGTPPAHYADLWYEFTMPFNGNVAITSPIVWNRFSVFEACGGNQLNCITGNGLVTGLQEGATYKLKVFRTASLAINPTFQSFTIQAFESAENDDCINATAINIQTTPQTINFALQSATSANEVGCQGTSPTNYTDLWYEFTMPFDGNVAITSQIVWNQFALYDACDGNQLNCITGNGLINGLQEGATYKLKAYRTTSLAINPTFQSFTIQAFESAENNLCPNASTIAVSTLSQSINFVLQSATVNNEVGCEGTIPADYTDLWYEFTMPVEGNVVITGPIVWNKFAIYDTCGGNEIACFDANGTVEGLEFGVTYKLRVYRTLSTTLDSSFQRFTIQAFGIVPNDNCPNAMLLPLGENIQTIPFTISSASINNEAGCEGTALANYSDIWYQFEMPFDGAVSIEGFISWNQFALYNSCGGTELACFNSSGLIEGLEQGITYYLRVFRTEALALNSGFQSFIIQAVEEVVFPSIGLVGTFNGFGNDAVMQTLDGELYTLNNFEISVTGVVKFRQDFSWDVNWGATDFPSGVGFQGGPDIPVPAGVYDITFNRLNGAYQFTLLSPLFPTIGIIGEFNNWATSVPMQTTDGINYELLDFYLPAPGSDPGLKFRQDNAWDINWGGLDFPSGVAFFNGPNIPVQEGNYTIYLNLLNLEYFFESTTLQTWFEDADGDGFGNPDVTVAAATQPTGYVAIGGDCNDTNNTVYPGAAEICYDGLDNDCDGIIDNGCTPIVTDVQPSQCGITLATIDSYVYANIVSNAQGYRFRVTNTATNDVQTIDQLLRGFRFTQLTTYAFNTTYSVEVSVRINNVWQPFYGTPCT
ncbi:MopE-related protein, partial [Flavobacterium lacus]